MKKSFVFLIIFICTCFGNLKEQIENQIKLKEGAKILGHEIGAHANKKGLGEKKDHEKWGQSTYGGDYHREGSPAEKLNNAITNLKNSDIKRNYKLKNNSYNGRYQKIQVIDKSQSKENGIDLKIIIMILLFLFSKSKTIAQNKEPVTFSKSQQEYKAKRFLRNGFTSDIFFLDNLNRDNFPIYYDKKAIIIDGDNIKAHLLSFGNSSFKIKKSCKGKKYLSREKYLLSGEKYISRKKYISGQEYISFSGDTIFSHIYGEKSIKYILSENFKDSTIYEYKQFENKYYYSEIKDTVYVFNQKDFLIVNNIHIDPEYIIHKIGISRKYGFVFINVSYWGCGNIEIWYY